MGKLRLVFLVFGLAVIHLSYAETISQPYSTAGWGTYANRDQE